MDLKDFVKTTLVDIVKGIDDANKELSAMNSFVATDNLDKIGNDTIKGARDDKGKIHIVSDINFDVAVTASESAEKQGGAGVSVLSSINLGGKLKNENLSSTTSRLKFCLPLALQFKHKADNK